MTLRIVGRTTDGRLALAGVFSLYETRGLPLDLICDELLGRGFVPAWDDFYQRAAEAGLSHGKIMSRVGECVAARTRAEHRP